MTQVETKLNDQILGAGWAAGAATADRLNSLLDRLSAKLELATVEVEADVAL